MKKLLEVIDDQEICYDIWHDKYRAESDTGYLDTCKRVVDAVYKHDTREHRDKAYTAMAKGLFVPGGRIIAGAGTNKKITLINCYVSNIIDDSLSTEHENPGIMESLGNAARTMQMGGGIGMDFSTLRPKGAYVHKVGAEASGPLPFMDMWNAMCSTIMSAGYRRGAMMATIHCTHPDLLDFIKAKHELGRLTQFNMSVLISDDFMAAVLEDEEWTLYHEVPPSPKAEEDGDEAIYIVEASRPDIDDLYYSYSTHKARDLWDTILKSTYEYSEPGVIFIDRVNRLNNLNYCETISCTNPCGEQPLPPNGACNLGAVNLARMVKNPFTPEATFDLDILLKTVAVGVRFLDNVIDITHYPLIAQLQEEHDKRRIGLGITGLANVFMQLGYRYGSNESSILTETILKELRNKAYETSALLASSRGTFPLYDARKIYATNTYQNLNRFTQDIITLHGLRNGVLLTIAPTGTTSLLVGNVSSGIEPVFDLISKRKVLQNDGSHRLYVIEDYAMKLYDQMYPGVEPPDYFVTTKDLTVDDHLKIQAVCQEFIDASISKTINCPESMSFEDFKEVYAKAYRMGCKGCTTYKPSKTRGSVLESLDSPESSSLGTVDNTSHESSPLIQKDIFKLKERPSELVGKTHKIKWPHYDHAIYLTVNESSGEPYEIFMNSKSMENVEWTTALTLMISAILRSGYNPSFIPQQLRQVSSNNGGWVDGKFYKSFVAYLGCILEEHLILNNKGEESHGETIGGLTQEIIEQFADVDIIDDKKEVFWTADELNNIGKKLIANTCPKCNAPGMDCREGCETCSNCGYSKCF